MSPYLKDLIERVVLTFLEAFFAVYLANEVFDITNVDNAKAAAVAGIAAVLSLLKALVAARVAQRDTASLAPGV